MAIVYKGDVVYRLKKSGFTTVKMKEYKLLSQSVIQNLRNGESISFDSLNRICLMLNCQPQDIIEFKRLPEDCAIIDDYLADKLAQDRKERS